jgi:hypothetical protein
MSYLDDDPKEDLWIMIQKRPTLVSKETYTSVKRRPLDHDSNTTAERDVLFG